MWDEERNHHLFTASATTEAELLISLLAEFNMTMALPRGIPTLQAMSTKNWTWVDNVFTTENLAESLICCDTDPCRHGPGTDHVPILTITDLEVQQRTAGSFRDFRSTNWENFHEELVQQLEDIPDPGMIQTEGQFQEVVSDLIGAIQAAIEAKVPILKPTPFSR